MPIIDPTVETYRQFASDKTAVFRDYFFQCVLKGDDGSDYFITTSLHFLNRGHQEDQSQIVISKRPVWYFTTAKSKVIRKGEKPEVSIRTSSPVGALKTEFTDSAVIVRLDQVVFTCSPPSFHLEYKGEKAAYDLRIRSLGTPFWFNQGKEGGAQISQNNKLYGIELFGDVTGTLVMDGKEIRVTGVCIHEHLNAEKISILEAVWNDWIWVVFDDLYALVYEKQGGRYKDGCIYLRKEKEYLVLKGHEIDYPQWAYSPILQHDWPVRIEARAYTDKATLHIQGDVVRIQPWLEVNKYQRALHLPMADMEVKWNGTLTFNDGRVLKLENGRGGDEVLSVFNFTQ